MGKNCLHIIQPTISFSPAKRPSRRPQSWNHHQVPPVGLVSGKFHPHCSHSSPHSGNDKLGEIISNLTPFFLSIKNYKWPWRCGERENMPTRRVEKCVSGLSLAPTASGWKSFFFFYSAEPPMSICNWNFLSPAFPGIPIISPFDLMVKFNVIQINSLGDTFKFNLIIL